MNMWGRDTEIRDTPLSSFAVSVVVVGVVGEGSADSMGELMEDILGELQETLQEEVVRDRRFSFYIMLDTVMYLTKLNCNQSTSYSENYITSTY